MDAKLTLKLDKDVIEHAKIYAQQNHQSLSALVEQYFRFLFDRTESRIPTEISPTVQELSGIIHLEEERDIRDEYTTYLLNKYR